MSLQWTIVATFLYVEIAVVLLLMVPFISPRKWNSFFRSKFFSAIERQSNIYFTVFIGLLVLLFLDATREVNRYQHDVDTKKEGDVHLDAEMQVHMKLFRAQRNFYISGFALFLWLVLRRLVTLLNSQALLEANAEASLKQAKSASDTAQKLMRGPTVTGAGEAANIGDDARENYKNQVEELEKNLRAERLRSNETNDELNQAVNNVSSMKKQAEALTREYDRLLEDHNKLQVKYDQLQGVQYDKKGE